MDGCTDKGIYRLLRAVHGPSEAEQVEGSNVSIQIRDIGNPDAQAEVRQRIRGLIDAAHARYAVLPADDDDRGRRADQLREEVAALHLALIGYAPTRDQLTECGIE